MNITITFDSLEELKAFQQGVRVLDDSTPEAPAEKRQEPAEAPAKEETHKSTPNTEKHLTEADFTPGGGGVEGYGFLVRIELQEVVAGAVGVELQFAAGGVTFAGTFDFDDFGSEPC